MGDNSTDNTSEVTRSKGDTKLSTLAVGLFGLSEDMGVEELDDLLKEEELGHSVGDLKNRYVSLLVGFGKEFFLHYLTRPQRNEGTEGIPGLNLGPAHFPDSCTEGSGEGAGRAGLDLDLGHLQRTEGDIGEDLSGGRTGKPDSGLVLVGKVLTSQVHVGILENFIETILEHALEGVTNEGRAEAFPDTVCTLFCNESLEGTAESIVFSGVHLWWMSELRRYHL